MHIWMSDATSRVFLLFNYFSECSKNLEDQYFIPWRGDVNHLLLHSDNHLLEYGSPGGGSNVMCHHQALALIHRMLRLS